MLDMLILPNIRPLVKGFKFWILLENKIEMVEMVQCFVYEKQVLSKYVAASNSKLK